MHNNLKIKIEFELDQLDKLILSVNPLFKKCKQKDPDLIELMAIASFLHSFYTGIESIFTMIGKNIDKNVPSGHKWHKTLLKSMANENEKRAIVITEGLYDKLVEYMEFRHFFRHAYSFILTWDKMKKLFNQSEITFNNFKDEIKQFIR